MQQLTVAQLIEKLQEKPQDAYIEIEGCDCIGPAGDVTMINGIIRIERVQERYEWEEDTQDLVEKTDESS